MRAAERYTPQRETTSEDSKPILQELAKFKSHQNEELERTYRRCWALELLDACVVRRLKP